MPEIEDRNPGDVIFAAYANNIRDRAVMRYADETDRDVSVPLPASGDMAWLTSTGEFTLFDGVVWDVLARSAGADFTGPITLPRALFTHPSTTRLWQAEMQADGNFFIKHAGDDGLLHNAIGWVGDLTVRYYGVDGSEAMRFNSLRPAVEFYHPVSAPSGEEAEPAYSFNGDTDTGMFRRTANVVTFAAGGTWLVEVNLAAYTTGTPQSSATLRQILAGTAVPQNAWGKDGDVYIRHT